MEGFVKVSETEEDESIVEVPTEYDNSLLLTTLQAVYSGASGLKYRNIDTATIRGVRTNEGRLFPPRQDGGWGALVYFCAFPKETKRKLDNHLENSTSKARKVESQKTIDLIVLGIAWKTTEDTIREYFEHFGELLRVQLKTDNITGKSRGFGFIKFASVQVQMQVLALDHVIDGRCCEVKIPGNSVVESSVPGRVYIGRCSSDLTSKDLFEYFSKYGDILDVYIPRPFRGFAFITFQDKNVARNLCGEDHLVKGISVHVSNATQKIGSASFHEVSQFPQMFMQQTALKGNCLPWRGAHHQFCSGHFQKSQNLELPNLQDLGIGLAMKSSQKQDNKHLF